MKAGGLQTLSRRNHLKTDLELIICHRIQQSKPAVPIQQQNRLKSFAIICNATWSTFHQPSTSTP